MHVPKRYPKDLTSWGQLGLGNEFDYWAPALVAGTGQGEGLANVVEVSCGFNHTVAVVERP